MEARTISRVPASLKEHLHVSRARTLKGGWGERVLRTSPEQTSENPGPGEEECFAPVLNETQKTFRTPLSQ